MSEELNAPPYPEARKGDVVDDYHGTPVPDPYRWLEDSTSEETAEWIEAQNRITRKYIDSSPLREKIDKRLTELWDYPKYSLPQKKGDRYFFRKNDGLQNQSVLYMQEGLDGEPRTLLDPNALSEDGTIALSSEAYTEDGTLLAYALSASGSDRREVRIRNLDTGEDYDETLKWLKFSGIAWKKDNSGFFYNRFPKPGTVPKADENSYSKVYWHQLGTPQSEDRLVYENKDDKELLHYPVMTEDGAYLVLYVYKGTDPKNRLYYREAGSDGSFVKLLDDMDASYDLIDNVGSTFYIQTDLDHPKKRIVAIDLAHPARENWKEIIPESEDPIHFAGLINNQLLVAYLHHARHSLKSYELEGTFIEEVPLPTLGSIGGITGKREDKEMLFAFTSFLFPSANFRYDFGTKTTAVLHEPEIDFDPTAFETEQVFFDSKDGTRVPMFLVHKKGIELDGSHPTLLYGYGGFNAKLTPYFSLSRTIWMERGGIFALANVRGGGEYGEDWHQAGLLEKKQNVFDDFHAAAEWLIDNKYTRSDRLAIQGGSNGGLLVSACVLQRPDLYGAVVCNVPVTDMLRYHKFTVGRYWVSEYGNAEENAEHFEFMYKYSPLHNVEAGRRYPPILVTSADTDDRVVPMHSKKFVATLQEKADPNGVMLLRYETKAGHGAGKPTAKIIEEVSDSYAFLFKALIVEESLAP